MALLAASDDEDMNNDPLFNPLARNSNAAEEKEAFSYVPAVTSASSTSLSSVAISTSNPLDTPVASVSVSDANSHVSLGDDNDRDPPPVPAKDSSSSASSSSYTAQTPARAPAPAEPPKPTGPCCATHTAILKWLQMYPSTPAADSDGDRKNMIQIDNATKTSDMTGASFIVYQILTLSPTSNSTLHTVLRRYSEFESLRKSLQRLHPTVVIPPIPEKHSLADYASKQSKTKDDPTVIAKRRRMLTSFLNRVVRHPVLGADHMVHGFLEPGSWNEVLVRTNVPKSNSSGGIAKKVLGKGSLVSPDPHWTAAESYTSQFHASISHAHRTSRSIIAALESSATVSSDLAAQYNAWSLSEPPLGPALEKIGQAHEVTAKATTKLRNGLESNFAEPVQEQSQLAQAVDKVLEWRRERNVEWESVLSDIEGKRSQLAGLERTEQETARVQQGLARAPTAPQQVAAASTEDGSAFPPPSFPPAATTGGSSSTEEDTSGTHFPPTSSPPPRGPGSILSTLNSFIDNDPVATRRATISRTREKILSLTDRREQLSQDLQNSGTAIQADLDRYQREKMGELKSIMLAFAKEMRDWSRKAAQSWEEAEKEVERVEV